MGRLRLAWWLGLGWWLGVGSLGLRIRMAVLGRLLGPGLGVRLESLVVRPLWVWPLWLWPLWIRVADVRLLQLRLRLVRRPAAVPSRCVV